MMANEDQEDEQEVTHLLSIITLKHQGANQFKSTFYLVLNQLIMFRCYNW